MNKEQKESNVKVSQDLIRQKKKKYKEKFLPYIYFYFHTLKMEFFY